MFSFQSAFMALLAAMKHDDTGPDESIPTIVHDFTGRELNLTENRYNTYTQRLPDTIDGEPRSVEIGLGQDHFWLDIHHHDGQCTLFSTDEQDYNHPRNMIADHCRQFGREAHSCEYALLGAGPRALSACLSASPFTIDLDCRVKPFQG